MLCLLRNPVLSLHNLWIKPRLPFWLSLPDYGLSLGNLSPQSGIDKASMDPGLCLHYQIWEA